MPEKKSTSWGSVAGWYDTMLEKDSDTYQKQVLLPNLVRLLDPKKGLVVLDLACGQGFFTREFQKKGATVMGADISRELIAFAIKNSPKGIQYTIAPADNLSFIKDKTIDAVTLVLAIQNIENVPGVFAECKRVLKTGGRLLIVLNHPAFRVLKESSWGWDEEKNIQYRRIDRYLSEARHEIQMHPGDNPSDTTVSFHRPLQYWFKALQKNNFAVGRLEEWVSHRKSEPGTRAKAEDRARTEIPLFLFLEAIQLK